MPSNETSLAAYVVKGPDGRVALKTSVKTRAERRAKKPGYKLIVVPKER